VRTYPIRILRARISQAVLKAKAKKAEQAVKQAEKERKKAEREAAKARKEEEELKSAEVGILSLLSWKRKTDSIAQRKKKVQGKFASFFKPKRSASPEAKIKASASPCFPLFFLEMI
jgi:hypothetical protein